MTAVGARRVPRLTESNRYAEGLEPLTQLAGTDEVGTDESGSRLRTACHEDPGYPVADPVDHIGTDSDVLL
jgi:hypothetical protein